MSSAAKKRPADKFDWKSYVRTQVMCLIINHFVMYYSNPQVNYMVTVVSRLVIAVV